MIILDPTKTGALLFEVNIEGIDPDKVHGHLRLEIDGIEYGLPVKISEKRITVLIPPLTTIVSSKLKNNQKVRSKLELFSEQKYFNPWTGEIGLKREVIIESTNVRSKQAGQRIVENTRPASPTRVPTSQHVRPQQMRKVTDQDITNYMVKMGTTRPEIQTIVLEQAAQMNRDGSKFGLLKAVQAYYSSNRNSLEMMTYQNMNVMTDVVGGGGGSMGSGGNPEGVILNDEF
jgi:hypothetical protein